MGVVVVVQLIDLLLSLRCLDLSTRINLRCSSQENKFEDEVTASLEFTSMVIGISNKEVGLGIEVASSHRSASSVSQLLSVCCSAAPHFCTSVLFVNENWVLPCTAAAE